MNNSSFINENFLLMPPHFSVISPFSRNLICRNLYISMHGNGYILANKQQANFYLLKFLLFSKLQNAHFKRHLIVCYRKKIYF